MRWPMRRLVLAIALASTVATAAAADEPAPQISPSGQEAGALDSVTRGRKVEISQGRPSGFWGSTRPAVGGAYRWRLLGIGIVLAAATGYLMLRLVRRANTERLAREAPTRSPGSPDA